MTSKNSQSSATSIHARALLVCLTIHSWSARKYDRKVSADVITTNAASSDAGRFNKMLLPGDAKSYKTLATLMQAIRVQHYDHSLAWSDEGWRLLPTANYVAYTKWIRDKQQEIATALESFITDYAASKDRARGLLGKMYKDEDYPSIVDLRSRFSIDVKYTPLPMIGDVRVDLASDQIATIEQQIQSSLQDATKIAMDDAWQRLYDVVARISERLNDKDAIFRDTLIGNARELCDSLKRLNVTGDPNLERMRVQVLDGLTIHDPDLIRETPKLRRNVGSEADRILAQMSGLMNKEVA